MKNETFSVRHLSFRCHAPGCDQPAEYLCVHEWDTASGKRKSVKLKKCRLHARTWAEKNAP